MLKQRIITALVLLAILLTATLASTPFQFSLFVTLVVGLAAWEWAGFIGIPSREARVGYLISVLLPVLGLYVLLGVFPGQMSLNAWRVVSVLLLGLLFWIIAALLLWGYPGNSRLWNDPSRIALMGMLALLPAWAALVQLKFLDPAGRLVLLPIALASVADIAAYFSGRAWGRRKLAPQISPNKTWEGVWGGVVATVLLTAVGVWVTHQWLHPLTLAQALFLVGLSVPLVFISVVGDLYESMLKRNRDLKDSGRLLPGHGGILDRIDSLIATAPLLVLGLGMVFTRG